MENFAVQPDGLLLVPNTVPGLLYIHIPFCESKCSYCVFATEQKLDHEVMDFYVQSVLMEIENNPRLHLNQVECIDVGGGTPTVLPARLLEKLLARLSCVGSCNAIGARSIETTPIQLGNNPDKIQIIHDHGFHRISMGVQTTSDLVLGKARRKQTWHHVERANDLIRKADFHRLNMDLIFGLPGQSLLDWKEDIASVAVLRPDSITAYDCIYRGSGDRLIGEIEATPQLELLQEMYDWAYEYLTTSGYHADYGSVNFSLHLGESGTSRYFERRLLWGDHYIGIGNYATSLVDGHWMFNFYNVNRYIENVLQGGQPIEYCYILPPEERYAKYVLFSLNFGILMPERFYQLFGRGIDSVYGPELNYAEEKGWIVRRPNRISVANGQFSNLYFLRSLLYSSKAKEWFMAWCRDESKA